MRAARIGSVLLVALVTACQAPPADRPVPETPPEPAALAWPGFDYGSSAAGHPAYRLDTGGSLIDVVVRREQRLEQGCSRSRHPDDEDPPLDRRFRVAAGAAALTCRATSAFDSPSAARLASRADGGVTCVMESRRGPRGPSGVMARCIFLLMRNHLRIAARPPRPVDPRTAANPM